MKRILIAILLITAIGLGSWLVGKDYFQRKQISTFEECAQAGYPVAESYPRQCRTADGKNFVEIVPGGSEDSEIVGEVICLPKLGDGPQTLECAMGLKGGDGNNYALNNTAAADPNYQMFVTGKKIRVRGKISPDKPKGPDGNTYDVVGSIEVTNMEEVGGT